MEDTQQDKAGDSGLRRSGMGRRSRIPEVRVQEAAVSAPEKRTLRRKSRINGTQDDAFFVPPEMIPSGYSVEWKRYSTLNEEDNLHINDMQEQGWEFATVAQFPKLVPPNYTKQMILRKGMALMIRPKEYTDEARAEDLQIARSQVGDKMAQLGQTPKGEMDRRVQELNRSYQPIPVDD
jgi:hypothetical protein